VPYTPIQVTIGTDTVDDEPQAGLAYAVSATHFPTLDIEPSLGRSFSAEEEGGRSGAPSSRSSAWPPAISPSAAPRTSTRSSHCDLSPER
jgi:hypothetical protein